MTQAINKSLPIWPNLKFSNDHPQQIHQEHQLIYFVFNYSSLFLSYLERQMQSNSKYQIFWKVQLNFKLLLRSIAGIYPNQFKKINQDSFLICENFAQKQNSFLFTVLDGHGQYGHLISQFVNKQFKIVLEKYFIKLFKDNISLEDLVIQTAFIQCINEVENQLIKSGLEVNESGTTLIATVLIDQKLWIANIGDCRGILIKKDQQRLLCHQISKDHKPSNPDEQMRIKSYGGRISPVINQFGQPLGPPRVWIAKGQNSGLAMSRSIGDINAQTVGVISTPEIFSHQIQKEDLFIVLASDGIWEWLSNEQVVQIIIKYYNDGCNVEQICNQLIRASSDEWQRVYHQQDDISCIVIQLK